MENTFLKSFIEHNTGNKMHFVLTGAVVSGDYSNLIAPTSVLDLKNCTIYTGGSKIFIENLQVLADQDIHAWGTGDIKEISSK